MTIRGFEAPHGERLDCDVVVVGAGPGGGAVVRVLCAAGLDVIQVEEGPGKSNFRPSWAHTARYHYQEGGGMIVQGPVPFPVVAGRGVGGGSLVNSAICFRTPDRVLEEWVELLGDDRYEPARLASTYEEIETRIGVRPVNPAIAGENNMIVVRGVEALGLGGGLLNRNTPGCVGCGICNFGCPTGGKASVDKNLIADGLATGNLRIQADCRVIDVMLDGDRAVGVVGQLRHPDTRVAGPTLEVRARKGVVLSAGALGTPRLLWSCGMAERCGPVGARLFLHPGTGVVGVCDHEVHMWKGATQGAYVWDPENNPDVLPHTFSAPPEVFVAQAGAVGLEAKRLLAQINHLCGLGVMVHDKGDGTVRATKGGRVKLHYTWDPEDVDVLKRGMVLSARVLLAGGAREVFATAFGSLRHTTAESMEAELKTMPLSALQLYSAHPMATCAMGPDKETSVLDSRGRSHTVPGLWFMDAGAFPTSLGVNPQLTTMTVSTLNARAMLEDL
jgi:choline dehydrogenase-like flavoprotein